MAKHSILFALFAVYFSNVQAMSYGTGSVGMLEGRPELQAMLLEYREVCVNRSGSDEGFQKSITSLRPAIQCVVENIDLVQLTLDLGLARQSSEGRKLVHDNYCSKFNESVDCFGDVLEGAAMCSTNGNSDDVMIMKNMYLKMVHNIIDLLCKNDGQILLDAATPEFKECLKNVKEHKNECKATQAIQIPISQYGEEECSAINRTRNCVQEKADSCSTTTTLMEIFDAIFQPLIDAANCQRFPTTDGIYGNSIDADQHETILQNSD